MRKLIALFIFSILTACAFAQSDFQDVVYLKNGSIIRGMIIAQVPNKSLKIETGDGSVFVYELTEVEKITKEPRKVPQGTRTKDSGKRSKYRGIVDVGYQIGVGDLGLGRLSLNVINGFQLDPFFSIGLGTGLRFYTFDSEALIPLFIDLRATFNENKVTPFVALGAGYSLDVGHGFSGIGLFLNPSAGISFKISERNAMHIGLNYEMQRFSYTRTDYTFNTYTGRYQPSYSTHTANSGAFGLNVGISF